MDRRHFLRMLGIGGAAAALPRPAVRPAPPEPDTAEPELWTRNEMVILMEEPPTFVESVDASSVIGVSGSAWW